MSEARPPDGDHGPGDEPGGAGPSGEAGPSGGAGPGTPAASGGTAAAGANGGGVVPLAPRSPERDRVHWMRLNLIWLAEMIVVEPIIYFLIWKHIPPGAMTNAANGTRFDALVATMTANGGIAAVIIYFVYAFVHWHEPKGDGVKDGPALRSHYRVQFGWIFFVSATVLGLFCFGTYELIVPAGSGGGEGPSPIWVPSSKRVLPIQVIGQQWYWTYRYPTFGGFETTQLVIPNHTTIAFHVTSLDVIHDWWAYQLSIKADANPGQDNVAFATTYQTGTFAVRCDELCGIWHGAMYGFGHVVSKKAFMSWATTTARDLAPATRLLPKFAWTYYPSANGAFGSFYPTEDPYYKFLTYGAGKSGPSGLLKGVHVKPSGTPASKGITVGKGNPFERAEAKGVEVPSEHVRRHATTHAGSTHPAKPIPPTKSAPPASGPPASPPSTLPSTSGAKGTASKRASKHATTATKAATSGKSGGK